MAQPAEAAKQRYARELAAYTLQQWNIARERQVAREMEGKQGGKSQPKLNLPPITSSDNHSAHDGAAEAAIKAVDYALRTAAKQNGDT